MKRLFVLLGFLFTTGLLVSLNSTVLAQSEGGSPAPSISEGGFSAGGSQGSDRPLYNPGAEHRSGEGRGIMVRERTIDVRDTQKPGKGVETKASGYYQGGYGQRAAPSGRSPYYSGGYRR